MTENFPNLKKEIYIYVLEAQKVSYKMNPPKKPTSRYIIIKMSKVRDRQFERQQGKYQMLYIREPPKAIS